jgi:hypothetical protein
MVLVFRKIRRKFGHGTEPVEEPAMGSERTDGQGRERSAVARRMVDAMIGRGDDDGRLIVEQARTNG